MNRFYTMVLMAGFFLLSSCGTYFNQPFTQKPSRTGEFSYSTQSLIDLPDASDPVEVAVYNFSDQTGQYKAIENGSTFSTAVTQGGTTILIKALEDSGWFIPIERENLSNLSTERNIIRNTKQEYIKNLNPNEPPLPPLLYAGLILEGGIVSYDTNIVTGGLGARYFGLGASARYRQDRITVYLRAVSTNNGQILKTVYVSKTILSQSLDANLFRFVKFQRLLETETGITKNEPVQLAVKDAVEKAVRDLIMEGIIEGYWSSEGGEKVDLRLTSDYLDEKRQEESLQLYDRVQVDREFKSKIGVSGGATLINADYSTQKLGWMGRFDFLTEISPNLSLGATATAFQLNSGDQFTNKFGGIDFYAQYNLLPYDNLSPYVYAGPGLLRELSDVDGKFNFGDTFFKLNFGAGVEYYLTPKFGIKAFGEYNLGFSDQIDRFVNGRRNDRYLNFGVGVNYYFNFKKKTRLNTQRRNNEKL